MSFVVCWLKKGSTHGPGMPGPSPPETNFHDETYKSRLFEGSDIMKNTKDRQTPNYAHVPAKKYYCFELYEIVIPPTPFQS